MKLLWTNRDLDLVETLARRVRLLAVEQAAAGWWPQRGSLRIVRRRLRRLSAAGLIHRTVVNAHPLLQVEKPLVRWTPGERLPDFERISESARARWGRPSQPQEVIYAGRLAANLFGSSAGRLPVLEHRDHDLLLGQVYLHYRTNHPREAARWLGEAVFPKGGFRVKNPDAFLVGETGEIQRAIHCAGRYSPNQVERFHHYSAEDGLSYELW